MSRRIELVALRIALIKAEFSEEEIREAVSLLESKGTTSDLLAYLAGRKIPERTPNSKTRVAKNRSPSSQVPRAVVDLEHKDPQKYQLLAEFDGLIRQRRVLPANEDIRRLGESISKDFDPRSSRREAISALMALLAVQPIDKLQQIMQMALRTAHLDSNSSEYQELARFIISGHNE